MKSGVSKGNEERRSRERVFIYWLQNARWPKLCAVDRSPP
jgi:hypothetical protein